MAKAKRKPSRNKDTQKSAHAALMEKKRGRDRILTGLAGVLILAIIGGLLWFQNTRSAVAEDYSIVGQGDPVIVQIHMLNCGDCDVLRASTREALREINDDSLKYRIAYLHKKEGIEFASKHGVARETTLIMFDGFGRRQNVINGPYSKEELLPIFRELL